MYGLARIRAMQTTNVRKLNFYKLAFFRPTDLLFRLKNTHRRPEFYTSKPTHLSNQCIFKTSSHSTKNIEAHINLFTKKFRIAANLVPKVIKDVRAIEYTSPQEFFNVGD
jgi:hypothetical protein